MCNYILCPQNYALQKKWKNLLCENGNGLANVKLWCIICISSETAAVMAVQHSRSHTFFGVQYFTSQEVSFCW